MYDHSFLPSRDQSGAARRLVAVLFMASVAAWLPVSIIGAQPPATPPESGAPAGQVGAQPNPTPTVPGGSPPPAAGASSGDAPPAAPEPTVPEEDNRPLYDQEPFDRITLNDANKNAVLKVVPLSLPNRRNPPSPGSGNLRVRFLNRPGQEFSIEGSAIVKVELFEQMLLAEGDRLTAEGKLDEAFLHYTYLRQQYPETPFLMERIQDFLYLDAGRLFRENRYSEALGVLEELRALNPNFKRSANSPTVMQLISAVADKQIADYLERGDMRTARVMIQRLAKDYPKGEVATVAKSRDRMIAMATEKRDQGREHLAAKRYKAAQQSVREMLNIWPDIEGAAELDAAIFQEYPVVVVGVAQTSNRSDLRSLDNWGARRTGRLEQRDLLEYQGPGPEGGRYASPIGKVNRSEDRLRMTFELPERTSEAASSTNGELTAFQLANRLLNLADPSSSEYQPDWAAITQTVGVLDLRRVQVSFRRPHVLPEPLLQVPLVQASPLTPGAPGATGAAFFVPYRKSLQNESITEYSVANREVFAGPAEVVERYMAEPNKAIAALRRGEIDVIDRLFPADAVRLASDGSRDKSFVVKPYALPTVHLLVPNSKNPFLANRTFRRALVYAINRGQILNDELLGGRSYPGCRTLSAPFPGAASENDPLAYAYDDRVEPWSYDPRLGKLLTIMAQRELDEVADKRKEAPPKLQTLVLAHPAYETARVACQAIAAQLNMIGVKVNLKELPVGESRDPETQNDLTYVEVAMWEPLADAKRLLGTNGIAPCDTPYVRLALRQLDESASWREVYQRFQELHRALYTDVTLLPLWQTVDFYAHTTRLQGLQDRTVYLYDNVENWRTAGPQAK